MPSPSKSRRRPGKVPPRPPPRHKTTRCILPALPPDLLQRICRHDRAITLDNAALSKALLPHTLVALARYPLLNGPDRLASLCVALRRRPLLVDAVEELDLSFETVYDAGHTFVYEGPQWTPGAIQGQLGRDRKELEARKGQHVDVENFKLSPSLLQDLCGLLPNLRRLRVYGVQTYGHLVEPQYLAQRPFHRLHTLELLSRGLYAGPEVYEPQHQALFRNIALIPTLRHLILDSSDVEELPRNNLGVDPSTFVPPRSIYLKSLVLSNLSLIGIEVRAVFSALQPGLTSVHISSRAMYDGLVDDLVRLPPTVLRLLITLGDECPRFVYPDSGPKFDSPLLPLAFPNLQHLGLDGPLVSSSTFPDVILRLSDLHCLTLGAHADVDGAGLVSLLRGGPPSWPKIRHLTLDICQCASLSSWPATGLFSPPLVPARVPRFVFDPDALPHSHHEPHDPPCTDCGRGLGVVSWPARLRLADMRAIAMIAVNKDIDVRGSAVCAARMCGGDGAEGHRCPTAWARAG
ncbi:hypothetical protein JCM3775_003634 [Rhodotorula graminis]